MARHVVSVMSGAPAALSPADPVLEANVYAVAEDVDLAVVLRGAAIEYAVAGSQVAPVRVADHPLPNARCARDLRGLVESGVPVYVDADGARALGLQPGHMVAGVSVVEHDRLAALLRSADAVLNW